jgi:LysM repeat protein
MRRFCLTLLCTSALSACLVSTAAANVPHTVGAGETLWSIAAANGFTTRALAAANGLSVDSQVRLGATIQIPSVPEAQAALGLGGGDSAESESGSATASLQSSTAAAPAPMGAYTVRPGDSLSAIAARVGAPMGQIAFMNGLSVNGVLIAGTVIKLPTSGSAPMQTAPVAQRVIPHAAPYASSGHVGADQIAQIAASHGVSSSLADAIAWQESGFNNASVSNANARGVMQIMPGTWNWIQGTLANRPLNPASPTDNVHAGVLYLGSLLRSTGGDASLAAAAYYQGLGSVRRIGMLPETRRYVSNVMALRARFGG